MAKTFTQNNFVSVNFGESETDSCLLEELEYSMQDTIEKLKNLRVRPSFGSIRNIMEYAKNAQQAELN